MRPLLIIGSVWPEPESSASGARLMDLIALFQSQGRQIVFASAASDSEFMFNLESLNVQRARIALNSPSFDEFLIKLNPEIVVFDRFMTEEQYGWRVAEHCPQALRILDTQDLHCLRQARAIAVKAHRPFTPKDLFSEVAKKETAAILRSDLALIISEFELNLLRTDFKIDGELLYYLPLLADTITPQQQNLWPKFNDRKDFVFIGNLRHEPNWDSVLYIKNEIWPLIRKQLPTAKINIYGAYLPEKAWALHQPREGFIVQGRAQNAWQIMQAARVCLAPLRFGAGLKGKLLAALINGTPSVTTAIGAEGLAGALPWSGVIAKSAEELATSAIRLHEDQEFWNQSVLKSAPIINQRLERNLFAVDFDNKIQQLLSTLIAHRQNNWVGALLLHHTTASTKYLSRWIEEKSRSVTST